jgi:hypothetical protein
MEEVIAQAAKPVPSINPPGVIVEGATPIPTVQPIQQTAIIAQPDSKWMEIIKSIDWVEAIFIIGGTVTFFIAIDFYIKQGKKENSSIDVLTKEISDLQDKMKVQEQNLIENNNQGKIAPTF